MPFSCSAFEDLIKNLMSELPADSVTYNRPVRCVHWNSTENGVSTVTVECDDGERIAADHVIVTVPLGTSLYSPCTIDTDLYLVLVYYFIYYTALSDITILLENQMKQPDNTIWLFQVPDKARYLITQMQESFTFNIAIKQSGLLLTIASYNSF